MTIWIQCCWSGGDGFHRSRQDPFERKDVWLIRSGSRPSQLWIGAGHWCFSPRVCPYDSLLCSRCLRRLLSILDADLMGMGGLVPRAARSLPKWCSNAYLLYGGLISASCALDLFGIWICVCLHPTILNSASLAGWGCPLASIRLPQSVLIFPAPPTI